MTIEEARPVDQGILRYAVADLDFYDEPGHGRGGRASSFTVADDRAWDGWAHGHDTPWTYWHPRGLQLPDQGWKVHLSATPDNAQEILHVASGFCHTHRLSFKHLTGPAEIAAANSKDADRAGAGKFVTIYPEDDDRLHLVLTGLDDLVGGLPGPYVLSDLRWNDGPLFVRYGAFARAWTRDRRGQRVAALRDPSGALVEDRRTAGFTPPDWAPTPAFLRAQIDALTDDAPPHDFGYTITQVLHYSNAGGVYEATDRDGARVVLKEGRPYAGLTPDGRDAATRLTDEEARLRLLAGPDVVAVHDAFTLHEHRFLVLRHVEGTTLNAQMAHRSPAVRADATPASVLEYRQWALGIAEQVERAIARIHATGYVHGDLHPGNVIVTPDDTVVLLDFEASRRVDEHESVLMGVPGYVAPDHRGGFAADRYALACLKLALFCPLTSLLTLDSRKAGDLLDHVRRTYALDKAWADAISADLNLPTRHNARDGSRLARRVDETVRAWDVHDPEMMLTAQVMIGRSLDVAADYSRADRLWPGDPRQFTEAGFGLAYGAAGVIHALDSADLDLDAQALDWLDDATCADRPATDLASHAAPISVGLFDGLAGAGWLHRLQGRHHAADALLARVLDADLSALGPDLYGGLAGVGLYLLSESDGDPGLLGQAQDIASRLRRQHTERDPLDPNDPAPVARTDHAGLMWGATGTALFALRLYEWTGDPDHLALATDALDYDLAHCTRADDGSLQVNEGWRLMPYLATGSVGIGLVAAQLIPHVPEPERYLRALDGITAAACVPFTIEPGVFYGRAGLIHYLTTLARLGMSTSATDIALARHVNALKLHALRHRTGIGFPGRGLLRMSCDLATGSAGILTALKAYSWLIWDEQRPGWDHLLPLLLPGAPTSVAERPRLHAVEGR